MKINTLADLYLEQIRDMHSCERQIITALPKMAKAANHPKLKKAFEEHLEETKVHLERLDSILSDLEKPAGRQVCAAAAGLMEEADGVMKNEGDEEARDAGLICAAQKVEHYEIASYGCLRTYATKLDREQDAKLLEKTLKEEKHSDVELTKLAMSAVNDAAMV
ncbi:MAG: ferritin-like domain-containing protein [Phycisphaerales bacterium]|nr:ferritin-like domain-containing protein [Phycisphaerales bacterium]